MKLLTIKPVALAAAFAVASAALAQSSNGAVYTMTNSPAGNAVVEYDRDANGNLGAAKSFATGGLGTGSGLGSQGSVTLSQDNRWLFAVNAGSGSVSVFAVKPNGLTLAGVYASGGNQPVSVAQSGDLVVVLNAGAPNSVAGFRLGGNGTLAPTAVRPLSGPSVGPGQVAVSQDGDVVVVTEKGTNQIDTFSVDADGQIGPIRVTASSGATPFGFMFGHRGQVFVSEAFGGAANASALSSYGTTAGADLNLISGSVPTHQTAACWTLVSKNGRFAYTTNAGSSSVSGYAIQPNGTVSLLDASGVTATTGANTSPTDIAQSENGRYVYVLTGRTPSIAAYRADADGGLTPVTGVPHLPAPMFGLAAR